MKATNAITAEQAIEKIESETTAIFGQTVKANTPILLRQKLQKMAEQNELSPKEYYRALKRTYSRMSAGEKREECEACA